MGLCGYRVVRLYGYAVIRLWGMGLLLQYFKI